MTQINTAKRDPKNTWRLINELTSRKTTVNNNVKAIKKELRLQILLISLIRLIITLQR